MLISNALKDFLIGRKQIESIAHGATGRVVSGEEELLDLTYGKCPEGGVHRVPSVVFCEIGLQCQTDDGFRRRRALVSRLTYMTIEFRVKVVIHLMGRVPMDEPAKRVPSFPRVELTPKD